MYHYVYKLINPETNEYYYGSRTSKNIPEQDKYLGSMCTWKPDKTKLIKTIIKDDFITRNEAMLYEADLIREHFNNDLNRNYRIPNEGYNTQRMVVVKGEDGKCFLVSCNDKRYLNGELSSPNKGISFNEEHKSKIVWTGKKHSDETKDKMSKIHKLRGTGKCSKKGKRILQFSLNNELIKEWNSITEAGHINKISAGNIHSALNGKFKQIGGFIWKYKAPTNIVRAS